MSKFKWMCLSTMYVVSIAVVYTDVFVWRVG
jgi:hypothetical protein